jgi:protein involved in polysaccharide export with SLBB domain
MKRINHRTPWPAQLLCILLSALTACGTTSPFARRPVRAPQKTESAKGYQYIDHWGSPSPQNTLDPGIAPGVLLTLHSLADPKLDGDFRVGFDGNLLLPYDMTVNTTGFTLSDLKKKLNDIYRPYFKTPSDIEVRVKERRYWVDVRGLVDKPGRYLVEPESSLDYVIGLAGGISKEERPLYVRIQKGPKIFVVDLNEYYSQGEDHPQIQGWLGGEILFFQKEPTGATGARNPESPYRLPVYMLGEVRKPGGYTLNSGGDFLDSLVQAGGFTERADLDNIELIRRVGGERRYDFSWKDLHNAPTPMEGDIIMVHADTTSKFERHTTLIIAILSAIASVVTSAVIVLAYNKGRI